MLKEDHSDTLPTLGNYTRVLALQRRLKEAQEWNELCLPSIKKNRLEKRNTLALRLLHNKSHVDANMGQITDTQNLMREVVQLKKSHLCSVHPETLLSIRVLGLSRFSWVTTKSQTPVHFGGISSPTRRRFCLYYGRSDNSVIFT